MTDEGLSAPASATPGHGLAERPRTGKCDTHSSEARALPQVAGIPGETSSRVEQGCVETLSPVLEIGLESNEAFESPGRKGTVPSP